MTVKYITHITVAGNTSTRVFPNKEDALDFLMTSLFSELHGGDGENGGRGSLWRCAKEIYDILSSGRVYIYADCEFFLSRHEIGDYGYVIVDNDVIVSDYTDNVTFDSRELAFINLMECIKQYIPHDRDYAMKVNHNIGGNIYIGDAYKGAHRIEFYLVDSSGNPLIK